MPYKVEKRESKTKPNWAILKEEPEGSGNWKIVGRSTTKSKAEASVRARYANE